MRDVSQVTDSAPILWNFLTAGARGARYWSAAPLNPPPQQAGLSMSSLIHGYRTTLLCSALAVLAAASGCAGSSGSGEPSPRVQAAPEPNMGPVITRLEPSSGWAGTAYPIQVTIHGTGFMKTGSVVVFGPVRIPDRASTNDGTRIVFSVPKERPSTGEVPPMVLPAGEYAVTVTTESGKSTPVTFTLTRPGNG